VRQRDRNVELQPTTALRGVEPGQVRTVPSCERPPPALELRRFDAVASGPGSWSSGVRGRRSRSGCYDAGVGTKTIRESFEELLVGLRGACIAHYGDRLVSLAVFGSLGRGTPRPDSDIDVLVVAEPLPRGRLARVQEFAAVEAAVAPLVARARAAGLAPEWSPVLKTPAEVEAGSLLFLDMIDDARLLVDREGFLRGALDRFARRLARLGARRVWRGSMWYWDLKPDYRPGEVFEL
jgi:hypothetical protein